MRDLLYTEHQLAAALSTLESRFLDELQRREVTAATTELQADHDTVPKANIDVQAVPDTALYTAALMSEELAKRSYEAETMATGATEPPVDEFAILTTAGSLLHDDLQDDEGCFNWNSPSGW